MLSQTSCKITSLTGTLGCKRALEICVPYDLRTTAESSTSNNIFNTSHATVTCSLQHFTNII